jgi:hypothetical protein
LSTPFQKEDNNVEFNVDEETPSGINLWFLSTPSWAQGFGKKMRNKNRKMKRKTQLCSDWVAAHEGNRKTPEHAPVWWGCPRGNRCDYAHGETELEPEAFKQLQLARQNDAMDIEHNKMLTYINPISMNQEDEEVGNLVAKGLKRNKKTKVFDSNNATNSEIISKATPNKNENVETNKVVNEINSQSGISAENVDIYGDLDSMEQVINSSELHHNDSVSNNKKGVGADQGKGHKQTPQSTAQARPRQLQTR